MAFNHGSAFAVIIDIGHAPSVRDGVADFVVHPVDITSFTQDVQLVSIVHDHGPLPDHQPDHRHPELHAGVVHIRPLRSLPPRYTASSADDHVASDL